ADAGFADAGAVNAGVGLHFDGIFQDGRAGLDDLLPDSMVVFSKTEAVRAYDGSVLENNIVAQAAILAHDGVGVGEEVVSDDGVGVDDDVGQEGGVVSDNCAFADDDVGSDVGIAADFCGWGDDGGGVNAGRVLGLLIEEAHGFGEGEIGIRRAERGGGDIGKVGRDDDGSGVGGAGEGGVAWVGDEG